MLVHQCSSRILFCVATIDNKEKSLDTILSSGCVHILKRSYAPRSYTYLRILFISCKWPEIRECCLTQLTFSRASNLLLQCNVGLKYNTLITFSSSCAFIVHLHANCTSKHRVIFTPPCQVYARPRPGSRDNSNIGKCFVLKRITVVKSYAGLSDTCALAPAVLLRFFSIKCVRTMKSTLKNCSLFRQCTFFQRSNTLILL